MVAQLAHWPTTLTTVRISVTGKLKADTSILDIGTISLLVPAYVSRETSSFFQCIIPIVGRIYIDKGFLYFFGVKIASKLRGKPYWWFDVLSKALAIETKDLYSRTKDKGDSSSIYAGLPCGGGGPKLLEIIWGEAGLPQTSKRAVKNSIALKINHVVWDFSLLTWSESV